jgi:hypothetical protein
VKRRYIRGATDKETRMARESARELAGQCWRCLAPVVPGRRHCRAHLDMLNDHSLRYYRSKHPNALRSIVCSICRKPGHNRQRCTAVEN